MEMEDHTVDTLESTEETEGDIAPANTYVLDIDPNGFFLVKFLNTVHKALNGRQEVLPVPFVYVTDDQYFAQFIEPPYTKKRLAILQNSIKNRSPVPEMLSYPCQVLMYNDTYEALVQQVLDDTKTTVEQNQEELDSLLNGVPTLPEVTKLLPTEVILDNPVNQLLTGEESLTDIANGNSLISDTNNSFTGITPGSPDNNSTNIGAGNLALTSTVDKDNSTKDPNKGITVENNSAMPSKLDDVITKIVENEMKKVCLSIKNHIDGKIKELETKIITIGTDLDQVKVLLTERRPLMEQENIMSYYTFKETYSQYAFPLQSIAEFTDFNNDLKENSDLKRDLKKVLYSNINTEHSIKVNLTAILKNFTSGALIIQHTAQKEVNKKPIFSSTTLYKCIEEAILACLKESCKLQNMPFHSNPGLVVKALGAVINCATDWDGKRQKRTKRSRKNSDEDDGVEE